MKRYICIDTEFFDSNEETMTVVCAVLHEDGISTKFDLINYPQTFQLYMGMLAENPDVVLVAFMATAESRALLSLNIDPLQFKWIDLYVENIMLCNSNHKYAYGEYLQDGYVKYATPSNPLFAKDDGQDHTESPKNLLNVLFKMLGVRDTSAQYKEEMRNIILSKDLDLIDKQMDAILAYCESDTVQLLPLRSAINNALRNSGLEYFEQDQLIRGSYSVATGYCEKHGISLDLDLIRRIVEKTPEILEMHKQEVNKFFPFFLPETQKPDKVFKNGKVHSYKPTPAKKDMAAYQRYVESMNIPNFPKTETGKYKADSDTLEEFGYWGGLETLWKYNKTEASLKWFKDTGKFFDRVGKDGHVRPYYGIFGTQTGRNAAKATTFPLAMSSWIRSIVRPSAGISIIGSDFSQQEVYVAAVLSQDDALLAAYNSGDVYLAFAKQAGLAPHDATKSTHKEIRNLCKSTVLGLQFGMGKNKLMIKLRLDSGKEVSEEETTALIRAHKTVYHKYWTWVGQLSESYKQGTPLITSDGWTLFCDNPVITSVRNFPVQANAASITRLAIVNACKAGLKVMCGLHDALYVYANDTDVEKTRKTVEHLMIEATAQILGQPINECTMRIDTKIVSHRDLWVEEKGVEDLKKLAHFLEISNEKIK